MVMKLVFLFLSQLHLINMYVLCFKNLIINTLELKIQIIPVQQQSTIHNQAQSTPIYSLTILSTHVSQCQDLKVLGR